MRLKLLLASSLLIFSSQLCFAQNSPQILKVEPPGWWAGHSINPVRVLIRGRNLSNARVEIRGEGLRVGAVTPNSTGTYLFVDVEISRLAKPGNRRLRITTGTESTEANFEILN